MTYETVAKIAQQGGTIYFGLLFVVAAVWVFLPRNKQKFDKAARMALDEDGQ